jgi:acetylglutamate kinase
MRADERRSWSRTEEVLLSALPYIREFHGQTLVVKLGGRVLEREEAMDTVAKDLALLRFVGVRPVVVHGGGAEISGFMEKLGMEPRFVSGLRVTDEATLDLVIMLLGKVNHRLVAALERHGVKGLGLSGGDASLLVAKKMKPVAEGGKRVDLGYVGEVETVNPEVLRMGVEGGYIPVVAPVAVDLSGHSFNVNADEAAGAIAAALKARKLLLMTDVDGLLEDPERPETLVEKLTVAEARERLKRVEGGMAPKLRACVRAAEAGVEAHIINGQKPHALLLELFTPHGVGTMVSGRK